MSHSVAVSLKSIKIPSCLLGSEQSHGHPVGFASAQFISFLVLPVKEWY